MALEDRPVAEITLLVLLVQATFIAAVLILLPLARWSREGVSVAGRGPFLYILPRLASGSF